MMRQIPQMVWNETNPLPVYGGADILSGVQYRLIVAAKSRAEASRITKIPKSYLKKYWSTTGNEAEIKLANSKAGAIFIRPLNDYMAAWAEYKPLIRGLR